MPLRKLSMDGFLKKTFHEIQNPLRTVTKEESNKDFVIVPGTLSAVTAHKYK